jgi:hypothetical protein
MVRFVTVATLLTCAAAFTVVPRSNFVARSVLTASPSSPTALSMGLFDRFTRVAQANLNGILQSLEDPEKIMGQALEDMQVRYYMLLPDSILLDGDTNVFCCNRCQTSAELALLLPSCRTNAIITISPPPYY